MLFLNILAIACLGIMSAQDIRQKKVSLWLIALLGLVGILAIAVDSSCTWQLRLTGVVPGIVLWIISMMPGNRIGSGDSYVLMVLGIHSGLWRVLNCLLYGTVFCALVGGIFLVLRKKSRKDTLPFLPFLTAGFVLTVL